MKRAGGAPSSERVQDRSSNSSAAPSSRAEEKPAKRKRANNNSRTASSTDSSSTAASALPSAGGSKSRPRDPFDLDAVFRDLATKKSAAVVESAESSSRKRKAEEKLAIKAAKEAETLRNLEAAGTRANRLKGEDSPQPLRFDATLGLPIYSESQLKLGGGGGTKDCPIDCNCCF